MLKPIDLRRRDGPLYPSSTKTLGDFIDRNHLLRQIDANFDFAALVEFLHAQDDPWIGRPAVHPEVVLRALILLVVYHVPFERQVCERIAENLAWRWFCYLTLDDPVFDHSSAPFAGFPVSSHQPSDCTPVRLLPLSSQAFFNRS